MTATTDRLAWYRAIPMWYKGLLLALVLLAVAASLFTGWAYGRLGSIELTSPVSALSAPSPMTLADRLVMTLAVGMDGSAVITSIGFASSDPRESRELELRGDTAEANGVTNVPTEPGTWRCVVEEWANEYFREFRVTEARRLM